MPEGHEVQIKIVLYRETCYLPIGREGNVRSLGQETGSLLEDHRPMRMQNFVIMPRQGVVSNFLLMTGVYPKRTNPNSIVSRTPCQLLNDPRVCARLTVKMRNEVK